MARRKQLAITERQYEVLCLLWADRLDPHTRVLHRLGEVAEERRPRLVDTPALLGQQVVKQQAQRGLEERYQVYEDLASRDGSRFHPA